MITFVGRPLDSAKALSVFLAALRIILRVPNMPTFKVWIIGGSTDDQSQLRSTVDKIPEIRALHSCGLIAFYGKVAYDAMPEFYSRSSILVAPSWFETFGRVAVESMSCGCPVIAADNTGLRETVLHGVTGLLYPASDVSSLAAIMADCISTPLRPHAWGSVSRQWTSQVFSLERQFSDYARLYNGEHKVLPSHVRFKAPIRRFQEAVSDDFLASVTTVAGEETLLQGWVAHPHHLVAEVKCAERRYLAIRYQVLAEAVPAPLMLDPCCQATRPPRQRLFKALRLLDFMGCSSPNTKSDASRGIAIYPMELVEASQESTQEDTFALLRTVGEKVLSPMAQEQFWAAMEAFINSPDEITMTAVDVAGFAMDEQLADGLGGCGVRHPQIEWFRLRLALTRKQALLDAGFVNMAQGLLDILRFARLLRSESITLQRHDGIGSHTTIELPLLLVLDECRFVAGPMNWAQRCVERLQCGANLREALQGCPADNEDGARLGVLWVIVVLIQYGMSASAEGHPEIPVRLNSIIDQITQMALAGDLFRNE